MDVMESDEMLRKVTKIKKLVTRKFGSTMRV